jgi:hypothetical protein
VGTLAMAGITGGPERRTRRLMRAGGRLPAGAVLAGLALLGGSVPASGQALTWSVVPSPNEGVGSYLQGVSCASAAACTAVGYYLTSGNLKNRTFIESWNGTSWSVVPSPNRGTADNSLAGVSCASAAACTAVGSTTNSSGVSATLIESWNGTSWSVMPSPNPGTGGDALQGVSCISAAACTAVGSSAPSGAVGRTLIESWNGTRWSVVPSPRPGSLDELDGVSCTSAAACTAVGYYRSSGGPVRTLIESWNGTRWSVLPSPNPGGSDVLFGVSCASAAACTAVGYYLLSGSQKSLIESWNGTSWSVVPSPQPAPVNFLYGVSCVTATACVAAGNYARNPPKTLIDSWNGTSWSMVPSPSPGSEYSKLFGVSCASAAACTAVGGYANSGLEKTLIETGAGTG